MILNFSDFRALMTLEADGQGAGAGAAGNPAPTETPAQGSVLFPSEGKPGSEEKPDPSAGQGGDKPASEWKEYEADPAKTDEENAAAKAEHDKTKPAGDEKPDPLDTVPEDGKYTLTMPEGVEVDQGLLDAISPEFKAAGLTTRQAQTLAEKFIAYRKGEVEAQEQRWGETVAGWFDAAKADKEMGGDNWDATVASAQRAIQKLGTPALRDYMEATGGGNHPELIRFASRVGALLREDSPPRGGAGGGGKPADPAHTLFPNDAPRG